MGNFLNVSKLLLATITLSGCVQIFDTPPPSALLAPVLNSSSKASTTRNTTPLAQAIFDTPTVARSFAVARAAGAQVLVVTTDKVSKIDVSGSTGFSVKSAAAATVTAYKMLWDNGQTDRSILLSELAAQAAALEAQIIVDETLQKIIEAYNTKTSSDEKIKIINYYLGLYNEREDLVETAVQAGVLSNSDYLELRALKNGTLSEKSQSVLIGNKADAFLKTTLGLKYSQVMSDLDVRHSTLKLPDFSISKSLKQKLIDLQLAQVGLKIKIQKTRNKPTFRLQMSLTSPQKRGADETVFAGISGSLPIKDGGEAAAIIEVLSKEQEVTNLDAKIFVTQITLEKQNWSDFLNFYKVQKDLLEQRKEISEQRIVELELRLKTGRSDVIELAKEILASASTEVALVQLEAEYLSQSLTSAATTGQTCGLLSLCKSINKNIPVN
jgi:outer membrane protein TolC